MTLKGAPPALTWNCMPAAPMGFECKVSAVSVDCTGPNSLRFTWLHPRRHLNGDLRLRGIKASFASLDRRNLGLKSRKLLLRLLGKRHHRGLVPGDKFVKGLASPPALHLGDLSVRPLKLG